MSKKLIIGVAGKSEVGKNFTASLIADRLMLKKERLSWPILACAANFLDADPTELLDLNFAYTSVTTLDMSLLELMQNIGDVLTSKNDRALIDALERRANQNKTVNNILNGLVVSDIRTPDEAQWVRDNGGLVVHVKRITRIHSKHRTECDLDILDGDYLIKNTQTQKMFVEKINKVISSIIDDHGDANKGILHTIHNTACKMASRFHH